MEYIILIPSYHPDYELIKLLQNIDKKYPVVVVDDGSGIAYQNIFETVKKYAHLISYEKNMGKGYALKTGLKYIDATYKNYIVVTMDSDGQHTLKDAIMLCDYVKDNLGTIALGKRHFNQKAPLRSRIGNALTRKIFKYLTKNYIYDTQTGLRAFSYQLTNYLLKTPGYRFEYEMNVLLNLKKDIPYKEIPIETIYLDSNKSSHFHFLKDSLKIYQAIFNWSKQNLKK